MEILISYLVKNPFRFPSSSSKNKFLDIDRYFRISRRHTYLLLSRFRHSVKTSFAGILGTAHPIDLTLFFTSALGLSLRITFSRFRTKIFILFFLLDSHFLSSMFCSYHSTSSLDCSLLGCNSFMSVDVTLPST